MKHLLAPLALSLLAPASLAQVPHVTRLDVDAAGLPGDGNVDQVTISSDGSHVAFTSRAAGLVPGQVGPAGVYNAFVREVRTGLTVQLNVDNAGLHMALPQVDGLFPQYVLALSGDGRHAAFTTTSGDALIGDANNEQDVYLRDLQTGRLELVSVGMTGPTSEGQATAPSFSDDGRYVAFLGTGFEYAPVPGAGAFATQQAYVRDRLTGYTGLVTRGTGGILTGEHCVAAALSGDGRSLATLVTHGTGGSRFLKVTDRATGTVTDLGPVNEGTIFAGTPSISIDRAGARIALTTDQDGLVAGDTDASYDAFLVEVASGTFTQVNLATDGTEPAAEASNACISPDGRYVSFEAVGDELFPAPGTPHRQVFVHDTATGLTSLGSVDNQGLPGWGPGTFDFAGTFTQRALSDGGRYLAYHSSFENLVAPVTPFHAGAFLFDRGLGGADLSIAGLTAGGEATLSVVRATGGGVVLVGLSATGQGPLASTWGILDVSPPLHTHHMTIDAAGVGSLAFPVAGLPVGQAVFAQGVDLLSGDLTTPFHGVVQ